MLQPFVLTLRSPLRTASRGIQNRANPNQLRSPHSSVAGASHPSLTRPPERDGGERPFPTPVACAASLQIGWTPLHLAASNGHRDAMVKLLEKGAVVDAPNAQDENVRPLPRAVLGRRAPFP